MRHFNIIAATILTVVLLTPLAGMAQSKFKNEDTATNRQDNSFGTRPGEDGEAVTKFGTSEAGDSTIDSTPKKQEEVDWYDKVIIVVDPNVDWPSSSKSTTSTTTSTESTDAVGDTSTSTSTTTTTTTNE